MVSWSSLSQAGEVRASGSPQQMRWHLTGSETSWVQRLSVPTLDSPWDTQLPCLLPGLPSLGWASPGPCTVDCGFLPHLCLGANEGFILFVSGPRSRALWSSAPWTGPAMVSVA